MIRRDELYFEPRCVNEYGEIKWYGEGYTHKNLENCIEDTVYIRDTGNELYVYKIKDDDTRKIGLNEDRIKAIFERVCTIKKHSNKFIYGRIIK